MLQIRYICPHNCSPCLSDINLRPKYLNTMTLSKRTVERLSRRGPTRVPHGTSSGRNGKARMDIERQRTTTLLGNSPFSSRSPPTIRDSQAKAVQPVVSYFSFFFFENTSSKRSTSQSNDLVRRREKNDRSLCGVSFGLCPGDCANTELPGE